MRPDRKQLHTWSGDSEFQYEGTVPKGITIYCGKAFSRQYSLTSSQLRQALEEFSGREVKIGTHRTAPPPGSIGDWIMNRFNRGGIMSYLGPILIQDGFAERGTKPDRITIKRFSLALEA
jgi:hypothetical protein